MSFLVKIVAWLGSSTFLKIFRGVSGPILKHYQSKELQETARQGIWAKTLVEAAQADVENRKIAAKERAGSPSLMFIYLMILFGPVLYYLLFWLDTIFGTQVWTILGFELWDWGQFELARAPARLEEMGKWVIGIFIGGNTAVAGVIKGAKILTLKR